MSVVQDVMAQNKSDLPDAYVSYLASCERQQAEWLRKFNDSCDKYGTWERRTPEQQAALDAYMAASPIKTVEIRTEEDFYAWLCERYVVTHGRVEFDSGLCGMNVDWNRVREMAEERGYLS